MLPTRGGRRALLRAGAVGALERLQEQQARGEESFSTAEVPQPPRRVCARGGALARALPARPESGAVSLTPYQSDMPRPSPRTNRTRLKGGRVEPARREPLTATRRRQGAAIARLLRELRFWEREAGAPAE